MTVKLLRIAEPAPAQKTGADIEVAVLIEIDGAAEWHHICVKPNVLPGFDAGLLVASTELTDRLRQEQYALHAICKLVGREIRGQSIPLPQQVAA